ncbi:MAG: hypothetical protein L3J39_13770 [Verrucomicrobiales bacterium]|nr:hypothetical protein [Verrucomicrobiales bacterium]
MKKHLAPLCVLLYTAFAILLLVQLSKQKVTPTWQTLIAEGAFQKYQGGDQMIIRQNANKAIINVDTVSFAEAVYSGKVKIVCDQPNSSTLIRIKTGQATILNGSFGDPVKIPLVESNGKVLIVNGDGIIVRNTAFFDWDAKQGLIPRSIEPAVVEHPHKQGNVYALAINKEGKIYASKPLILEKSGESEMSRFKRIPIITD